MEKTKVLNICDRSAFLLMCILMADCCIFGAGRVIMLGPISFRMIVLALAVIASVPLIVSDIKSFLKNKIVWLAAAFIVWLGFETVLGVVNGNDISLIITDLKGFAYISLLPVAVIVLNSKERIHKLMKVMMYASLFLSVVVILHFIMYLDASKAFIKLYSWGLNKQFSAIAPISVTIPRLFFKSSAYFLVGCAFPTYFQIVQSKISWQYFLITGLSLFCLLMTYTRSLYLAAGIAAIVLAIGFLSVIKKHFKKIFLVHIGAAVVTMCLLLAVFGTATKTNYMNYAVQRTLLAMESVETPSEQPPATDVSDGDTSDSDKFDDEASQPPEVDEYQQQTASSDQLRVRIKNELSAMIKESPVIGNGLGAALEWRSVNEYFYLDLTAKTGIVGLIIYAILPMALMLYTILRKKTCLKDKLLLITWICVLSGFMVFSYFNPYMNASLGVLYYSCVAGAFSFIINQEKDKDKVVEEK